MPGLSPEVSTEARDVGAKAQATNMQEGPKPEYRELGNGQFALESNAPSFKSAADTKLNDSNVQTAGQTLKDNQVTTNDKISAESRSRIEAALANARNSGQNDPSKGKGPDIER
jgi:hypothetical protein